MRKLATIRRLLSLTPIPNADSIELGSVDGWFSVVKKDEFKVGDFVVYLEVDSFVPHSLHPDLSKGKGPIEYLGVLGQPLRTVRLRGQLSQGLILPISCLDTFGLLEVHEGLDVSDILGITKWEPPIPEELLGEVAPFPSLIPKTEVDRVQNLVSDLSQWREDDSLWYRSEKIDGTSMTVYLHNGHFGVCGRNWEFLPSVDNVYTRAAKSLGIYGSDSKLALLNGDFALQGELVGPKIKGIKYGFSEYAFFLFRVYDIKNGKFLPDSETPKVAGLLGLRVAPLIEESPVSLKGLTLGDLLDHATSKSIVNSSVNREGVVYSNYSARLSFKVISNEYLLKLK